MDLSKFSELTQLSSNKAIRVLLAGLSKIRPLKLAESNLAKNY